MFGFGAKYCSMCGMKVEKGGDFERFGKHFCSEEHAQQYVQEMEKVREVNPSSASSPSQGDSCGGC